MFIKQMFIKQTGDNLILWYFPIFIGNPFFSIHRIFKNFFAFNLINLILFIYFYFN